MSSIVLSSLPQIVFGFLLYWMFPGWLVRQDLADPRTPRRTADAGAPFVTGQAVALCGLCATGGLLGVVAFPWTQRHALGAAAHLVLAILFLVQVRWILKDLPLDPQAPRWVSELSFRSGRDLILRHGLPLFLVFGLLVSADSATAARHQFLGIFLGWAGTNSLWGTPPNPAIDRLLRRGLALLSFFCFAMFLLKALHRLS